MIRFCFALLLVPGIVISSPASLGAVQAQGQVRSSPDHIAWVAEALKRMQTIKPGMTRGALLKVFTIEGGLFNRNHRTFVSRDCPYFKVEVEFEAVGQPGRGGDGGISPTESSQDIIVKISKPYLQFSVAD